MKFVFLTKIAWSTLYGHPVKAIPIKCFVSHRPSSREGGSVGRSGKKKEKKKKKEWTHDCILNLTFSLQDS